VQQGSDLKAEFEVGQMAEVLHAEISIRVYEKNRWGTLHLVKGHGERQAAGRWFVNGDWKLETVLVGEGLKGRKAHRFMVLKDSVDCHDR
jgi:hypothetical protein